MWKGLIPNGLSTLLPSFTQPCLLCAATSKQPLCQGCEFDLPYLVRYPHRCELCALPLASDSRYCGQCLQMPPAFDRCRTVCTYEFPLDQLIHAFKYRRKLTPGRALSRLLAEQLMAERLEASEDEWPELLVPVPMHWTRRLQRGFNQADLLAVDLGKHLKLPVLGRACRRQQRTEAQQGLTRTARQYNLRQAFELRPSAAAKIAGRRIALVDDVITTTSTARAVSRILQDAGAESVEVWALARTKDSM